MFGQCTCLLFKSSISFQFLQSVLQFFIALQNSSHVLGALQRKKIQKIRDYYGSGWVGPGLTRIFVGGKSSKISPTRVLIFWSSSLYHVYTLLKVVAYYDLSVLSMSVIGFQKEKFGWGWVGGVSSIQLCWILEFILTLQSIDVWDLQKSLVYPRFEFQYLSFHCRCQCPCLWTMHYGYHNVWHYVEQERMLFTSSHFWVIYSTRLAWCIQSAPISGMGAFNPGNADNNHNCSTNYQYTTKYLKVIVIPRQSSKSISPTPDQCFCMLLILGWQMSCFYLSIETTCRADMDPSVKWKAGRPLGAWRRNVKTSWKWMVWTQPSCPWLCWRRLLDASYAPVRVQTVA